MKQSFYVCYNKNKEVVKKSSSGGIFYTIASMFFSKYTKVKVYGCVLDEHLNAVHIGIENLSDIEPLMGSKYINSNINGIYQEIVECLNKEYTILFSGTPCQIHALNSIIKARKIDSSKLYTLDFVCHGVSNDNFFHDYIKHLEKKYKSKAIKCKFRTKNKYGKLQDMSVCFENGKKYIASTTKYDWFYSAYHKNLSIREQCFNCTFTTLTRNSDITMSDAWGNSIDGCWSPSLIIINSIKGKEIFNKIKKNLIYNAIDLKDVHNPQLYEKIDKPECYEQFNNVYKKEGFYAAQKFIGNNSILGKIRLLCANILYYFK